MYQLHLSNPTVSKSSLTGVLFLFSILLIASCQKRASTAEEAKERLVGVANWTIKEIYVDDVVRFKDGKQIPHFGGIDFGRHMGRVAFKSDGFFVGYFKGEAVPLTLKYELKSGTIVLKDADPTVKGGEWVVLPSSVTVDSFEMTTATAAYNYPATTTIRLLFIADKE